ncbi:MAG: SusC/RagA family TonB-linked outer membrane protein [Saprospiraceae bacterium]
MNFSTRLRRESRCLFYLILLLFFSTPLAAQRLVRGLVQDAETGEPLMNVLVTVKGNPQKYVRTNRDGKYAIELERRETILFFSRDGFRTKETEAYLRTVVNVRLDIDPLALNTKIATALGLEREEKTLGYAVQQINGRDLDRARDLNFTNNLAGKVAGLNVINVPSGVGNSNLTILRGERSLSLSNNQPLFVIDGVPVTNETFGSFGRGYQDVDFGNGAGFLNPNDMESVTILKGANAAALYGIRGSNGVISITSKTGKNTRGIGVSFNTSILFEEPLRLPKFQDQYGQGLEGQFQFADGNGGGLNDGVEESWGPGFQNIRLQQFDSQTSNNRRGGDVGNLIPAIAAVDLAAQLQERGAVDSSAWTAFPRNAAKFYETGVTQSYQFAVAGSNERGDFRLAYNFAEQKGIVPNTNLNRHNVSLSGGYELNQKLKARATFNYLRSNSSNRPNLNEGTENVAFIVNGNLPPSVNIASLRNYWQAGRRNLNQFNFNYNYLDNPYFTLFENTNSQQYDRLFGNAFLSWQYRPWLNLQFRVGTDATNEFRARRRTYSTQGFPLGGYREEEIRLDETNLDALASTSKGFSPKFKIYAGLGGNIMRQNVRISDISAPELTAPGVYNLGNSRLPLESYNFRSEKQINSLYALANLSLQQFIYLDLAARNDWSSTLPSQNRSVLSYSASLSAVLSDALKADPEGWLSLAQLRASYARTGNDTDPYRLQTIYLAQLPVLSAPTYAEFPILNNPDLQAESTTSLEAGVDLRFLRRRIGLDFTYFQSQTDNQILSLPLSNSSGYDARIINAGSVKNTGYEAIATFVPIQTKNFQWAINVNFARYRSEVRSLYRDSLSGEAVGNYVLADRYVTLEARPGERVGNIYGTGYERVSNDPNSRLYDATGTFVGQILFDKEGKPIPTSQTILLGNYNPDWITGFANSLTFKGFNFYLLFDIRAGGQVYARSQTLGLAKGTLAETLYGRASGYDLDLAGNGIVGKGAIQTDDGNFVENTTKISAREWYNSFTLSRPIDEAVVHDATFIKLRELRLSYTFSNIWLGKLHVRDAVVSVVGRNLLLLTGVPHIDPETATLSGGVIMPGVESFAMPSLRSFGVNVSFKF